MNIFVTSPDPIECAKFLDDKRVVKMVLETAQMLSTAIHSIDPEYHTTNGLYKPTHKNHPCTKWTIRSLNNFTWVRKHFEALLAEYELRYDRKHASGKLLPAFKGFISEQAYNIPSSFVNCAANESKGINYKDVPDTFVAYRKYLADRWDTDKRQPTWYGRG